MSETQFDADPATDASAGRRDSLPLWASALIALVLLPVIYGSLFLGLGIMLLVLMGLVPGHVVFAVALPLVPVSVFAALFIAWRVFSDIRGAPTEAGACCMQCGYNLTGNVSGRCPECGTLVETEEWLA